MFRDPSNSCRSCRPSSSGSAKGAFRCRPTSRSSGSTWIPMSDRGSLAKRRRRRVHHSLASVRDFVRCKLVPCITSGNAPVLSGKKWGPRVMYWVTRTRTVRAEIIKHRLLIIEHITLLFLISRSTCTCPLTASSVATVKCAPEPVSPQIAY